MEYTVIFSFEVEGQEEHIIVYSTPTSVITYLDLKLQPSMHLYNLPEIPIHCCITCSMAIAIKLHDNYHAMITENTGENTEKYSHCC